MGVQDDIFDVRAALKNKAESPAFNRICAQLYRLEEEAETRGEILDGLRAGIKAVQMIAATLPKERKKS